MSDKPGLATYVSRSAPGEVFYLMPYLHFFVRSGSRRLLRSRLAMFHVKHRDLLIQTAR